MLGAAGGLSAAGAAAATIGGDLTATTDYIFRGISQDDGRAAAQFDLHAGLSDGLFAGVWGSTLGSGEPRGDFELELYAGKRFELSSAWSLTLTGVDYTYLHRAAPHSADYQELSASFSYLDTWNLSVAASPNAPRYWQGRWLGRYPAYDADVTGQWPLFGPLYATAGLGYYYVTGPSAPGSGFMGYAYGNAGLAVELRGWRVDVGYYFADIRAQPLFPYYPASNNQVAATVSWRF